MCIGGDASGARIGPESLGNGPTSVAAIYYGCNLHLVHLFVRRMHEVAVRPGDTDERAPRRRWFSEENGVVSVERRSRSAACCNHDRFRPAQGYNNGRSDAWVCGASSPTCCRQYVLENNSPEKYACSTHADERRSIPRTVYICKNMLPPRFRELNVHRSGVRTRRLRSPRHASTTTTFNVRF